MTRKLFAWVNLAWFFGVHVLTRMPLRPFRHGRDLRKFTEKVGPEGYVPLSAAERAQYPRTMHCIQCGLCAIPCSTTHMSAWDEAWTFAAGASRSLDHASVVSADISACAQNSATQIVCPTGVPINDMAKMIQRMAAPLPTERT